MANISHEPEGDYYLYVIGRKNVGPWKIGISINPQWRIRDLQSGSPELLVIHCLLNAKTRNNAENLERKTHAEFIKVHSHGEWFDASLGDVIAFLNMMASKNDVEIVDSTIFTQHRRSKNAYYDSSTYKYRDSEKRKAYMRNYMKQKRAK